MASVNDIKYVVFGVQFSRSFKLLDSWGEIADDILYKTEYFDSDFFTNISTQYTTERNLHNPMTGNFLALSSNSLVFKYYIPNGDNFEKEYEYFTERVNKYLVEKILTKYNLVIRRIGTVFACQFNNKELDEFSNKYFKNVIKGITDFRFAQKGPTTAGQLWHGVDDYINKIYTVGKMEGDEGNRGITYDFQLYFNPLMPDIRKNILHFMQESLMNFKKDIMGLNE